MLTFTVFKRGVHRSAQSHEYLPFSSKSTQKTPKTKFIENFRIDFLVISLHQAHNKTAKRLQAEACGSLSQCLGSQARGKGQLHPVTS